MTYSAETQVTSPAISLTTGDRLGPYEILGLTGEGGMGVVYLAEQRTPIHRRVAIKVVKHGASQAVLSRFESERHALALMDHAHIARVLDAGATPSGQPYFVMEYVPGVSITEYCDAHFLGYHQRLRLFQQVCDAVHHAHQKGIIHRDLKPSNILVTEQDGKPVPKVIDFGVAKAINRRLTEETLFTEFGVMVGTPEYMSPEQADGAIANIDTTTDIYSLGVILYELLVGILPFDAKSLRRAGLAEIRRVLQEEEPPKPSSRLSTLGDSAEEIASKRQSDLPSLIRSLRGDLEWIVLKALRKERGLRYASASEFALDIERHLTDEPVIAGPPKATYRIRKFTRRHRFAVASVAAVFVVLILGLAATARMYYLAEDRRREADRLRLEATEQRERAQSAAEEALARGQEADLQRQAAQRQEQAAELARSEAEWESYRGNVAAVAPLLASGDMDLARVRLFAVPASQRDWVWRHLYARSDNTLATLTAHGDFDGFLASHDRPFTIGFSSGKIYLAMRHTVHAWDAGTLQPAGVDVGFSRILSMARDGTIVATVSRTEGENLVTIHDRATKRTVNKYTEHRFEVTAVAFSQNNAIAVSGDRGGEIRVWDYTTGQTIARARQPGRAVRCLSISPDDRWIAAGSTDALVKVYSKQTGQPQMATVGQKPCVFTEFSADGTHLFASHQDVGLRVYDVGSGRLEYTLPADAGFALSPDGHWAATSSHLNRTIDIWDTRTGTRFANLGAGDPEEQHIAFLPSGNLLFAANVNGGVRVWDVRSMGRQFVRFDQTVASADVSPVGESIAVGYPSGGRVEIWDRTNGSLQKTFRASGVGPVNTVKFTRDGSKVVAGFPDYKVRVLETDTGREVASMDVPSIPTSIAVHPRLPRVIVALPDLRVACWDWSSNTVTARARADSRVHSLTLSPDGNYLALGMGDVDDSARNKRSVGLWHSTTLKPSVDLESDGQGQPAVLFPAFSPSGNELAAGTVQEEPTIFVWDVSTGRIRRRLKGQGLGGITAVAYTRDGKRLFGLCPALATLQIWDLDREQPLARLPFQRPGGISLQFSPGDETLYATSVAGYVPSPVTVWDSRSAYPADAAEWIERERARGVSTIEMLGNLRTNAARDGRLQSAVFKQLEGAPEDLTLYYRTSAIMRPGDSSSNYQRALRLLEPAVRQARVSVILLGRLALGYYRVGRLNESKQALDQAAAVGEPSAFQLAVRALVLRSVGDLAGASDALGKARLAVDVHRPPGDEAALIAEAGSLLADGTSK